MSSPVLTYRSSFGRWSPYALCSTGSPPVTTFSAIRSPNRRRNVSACWAISVGWASPARNATRKPIRSVTAATAGVSTHGSTQPSPTGVNNLAKPACSAARATCAR